MKIKVVLVLLIVGAFVWAKTSSKEKFVQAKDFPAGALVYVQVADLPQFIKLWDESKLKEKYLASESFASLQKRHLGFKIAERWADLNAAIGFQFDLQTLGGLAEKQAAMAIYDIGKLDIVFVAPMNETVFSATMFAQNSGKFEEVKLENDITAYIVEAEFNRQRQRQKIVFANVEGRFILATGEKLFGQTISAIKGKQRLYDEPNFRKLAERITPDLATVWVNQEKLNTNYYFKRYWLMSEVEDLQNIRAGIFDLNLTENGLTEKREFLLKQTQNIGQISNAEAKDLIAKVPENVPFYRLQRANGKQLGEAIYETILDKKVVEKTSRNYSNNWSYYDDDNYDDYHYYYNLDSDYDEEVNQIDEDESVEESSFPTEQFSDVLSPANPTTILTATSPKMLENPLFAEFRKIAIIPLQNPNAFQSNQFENSIVEALKNRISVADVKFVWETENGLRKLKLPLLGWEIGYQLQSDKLFVTNSFEILQESLSAENKTEIEAKSFSDLTVICPANRVEIFDNVMRKLAVNDSDFFTGNVASLLNAAEDVKQIEIKRKAEDNFLQEEISVK